MLKGLPSCQLKGCARPARRAPVLVFYAPGGVLVGHIVLNLPICDEHVATATPDSFLCEAGWLQIEAALLAAGKTLPARNSTQLAWALIR